MKKSKAPILTAPSFRENRTLVVFESMEDVDKFLDSKKDQTDPYDPIKKVTVGEAFWLSHCRDAIKCGDPAMNRAISEQAQRWKDIIVDSDPRFSANSHREFVEVADSFDTGLIALDAEKPCFRKKNKAFEPNEGKGAGAYRVIINTDVPWWAGEMDGASVMGAIVLVLQEFAPVEIFVQQGWMGSSEKDGVTLIRINSEGAFNPASLAFWCGHPMKDAPYSFVLNRLLGRIHNHIAVYPQIDCNLYVSSFVYPGLDPYLLDHKKEIPEEVKIEYVKDLLWKVLFVESLSGWTVSGSGIELSEV